MNVYEVEPLDVLMLSIVVLYLGMYLTRTVAFLRNNYIPAAVSGGLACSACVALIRWAANVEIRFDMQIRDVLLLVFFSTIGLSAKLRTLRAGGRALVVLVAVAAVFLFVQDATGIALVLLLDAHPGYGLMAGSVSFAGGHGTAIAWGTEAEAAGLEGAAAAGIAFATFGLIAGGVAGGPIARRLIQKHRLEPSADKPAIAVEKPSETLQGNGSSSGDRTNAGELFNILGAILVLALCVEAGELVNRLLFSKGVLLPGFLTAMFVGILLTNLADVFKWRMHPVTLDKFGEVSLSIFLSMSLMSLQLWTLAGAAGPILLLVIAQTLLMTLFATFVVFRLMGRDYDACVISAGFVGLGLGATPVAIANMDAVTKRFGPSQKAFLIVPLVGAFFIDLLNAATIKFFIGFLSRWLA